MQHLVLPPSETHRQLNLVSRLKPSAQQIVLFRPALLAPQFAVMKSRASFFRATFLGQKVACVRGPEFRLLASCHSRHCIKSVAIGA